TLPSGRRFACASSRARVASWRHRSRHGMRRRRPMTKRRRPNRFTTRFPMLRS
ncbi:hypothetical protein PHISP_08730, partial [Aspergillus sp. HF37]